MKRIPSLMHIPSLMQRLMIDNEIDLYKVLEDGSILVEEGWDVEVMSRLNDRLNELEKDVRLLQQPSGSISWAKR